MQAFTYYCIICESITILIGLAIMYFILKYFIKELIRNNKQVKKEYTEKQRKNKIKKEQEKVKKLLEKRRCKDDTRTSL